jgi:hypothetical protein
LILSAASGSRLTVRAIAFTRRSSLILAAMCPRTITPIRRSASKCSPATCASWSTAGGPRAGRGSRVIARAGVKHSFRNIGGEEAHLRVEVEPALDLQEFLQEAAALARAGLYTRRGLPTRPRAVVELADLMIRYADTTVMAFPPQSVQRLMIAPLARLKHRHE